MPSPCPDLDRLVPVRLEHHAVSRPWGELHVVEAGPATADAIVLVHGWPQHWFAWRHVIAALAPTTRVLAIDVRGFGWSTSAKTGDVTIAGLAADVVAVLDHFGLASAHLAAHDWGGWIGFRAILDHPRRFRSYTGLAIVPPWLDLLPMLKRLTGWAYVVPMALAGNAIARWPAGVRFLVEHAAYAPAFDDEGGDAAMTSYLEQIGQSDAAAMTRRLYATLVLKEFPAAWGKRPAPLQMPTTVVVGDRETISVPQLFWARTHPGEIRVVTVRRARHWLAEERPDAVVDVLRRQLARTALPQEPDLQPTGEGPRPEA
ncbi:MAG: hypothetical protein QOD63_1416 [Actinomycetota bacterium]|jgi:pimeloyl-ACP methyl ester carboxylesterase|nr:hypothetical protein [Actinomycetota bacterium]